MVRFKDILLQEAFRLNYDTQMHIMREKKLDLKKITNVRNLGIPNKPKDGFWTSTAYEKDGVWMSAWYTFFETSGLRRDVDYIHIMEVYGTPKKLEISSEADYNKAYEKYGMKYRNLHRFLDWSKVAQDYDCVHIYGRALRMKELYGWDVESTCWWNPTHLRVKETFEMI